MGACCSNEGKNEGELMMDLTQTPTENLKIALGDQMASPRTEATADDDNSKQTSKDGDNTSEVDGYSNKNSFKTGSQAMGSLKERGRSSLETPTLGDGNYLIYNSNYDGCFFSAWRKEPIENALAFAQLKEGLTIPPFKYKNKSEIARAIHKSKKGVCTAYLQFLRSLKLFQCDFTLLDAQSGDTSKLLQVVLLMHFEDDKIQLLEANSPFVDLTKVDYAAAILINTTGEQDFRNFIASSNGKANLAQFIARCKQNSEHCEFTNLGAREL